MKRQTILFFTALQFYTRFPIPNWVKHKPENLSMATRFLPLIGWIVGGLCGLVWLASAFLINIPVGLLISMVVSILITGAFHEDGFADVCDGFGGGWTREKILEIMKDSRVGTYGSVGLIGILALKFSLLSNLALYQHDGLLTPILILVGAHAISRFMASLVIFTQPYARETQDSKSKPVAEVTSGNTLLIGAFFALLPVLALAWWVGQSLILLSPVFLVLITFFLSGYFRKWIGGYTGDCLGTVQQVTEVGFYLFLAVLWKFI